MLVVGNRVHAVERMRDIDDPALALDLRDGLLEAQTARDLLLDEQADDLALAGGLDLLADDHLDGWVGTGSKRLRARLERARDLVVVGHGDRAEALLARGRQQHLDRRGAVVGVVGVHVQVELDERTLGEPALQGAVPAQGMAARGERAVDPLELCHASVARRQQVVLAGEVTRHQLGCGGQRGGARVEPPEEALDEAPSEQR